MADDLSKLKSEVRNMEDATTDEDVVVAYESDSKKEANKAIQTFEALAAKKRAAGFVLRRIPIRNGYKEVWVIP